LAAENCAYAGARGLFRKRGADYVRGILGADPEPWSGDHAAATR
jgi:fructokinase